MDTTGHLGDPNSATTRRLLFVDDSADFLGQLRDARSNSNNKEWKLLCAGNPVDAFMILDNQPVDLIAIDLNHSGRSTGVDSLNFLQFVHREYPELTKVILSNYPELERRNSYEKFGAKLHLIKPKRPTEFSTVFQALNKLLTNVAQATPTPAAIETEKIPPTPAAAATPTPTPPAPVPEPAPPVPSSEPIKEPAATAVRSQTPGGFRGVLHSINLSDLIQLECRNLRSSILELTAGRQFGQVFIKSGQIIHARAGSKTGVEAFLRLMNMAGGGFNLEPFCEPEAQTISMSCDQLLLEASQALDEGFATRECGTKTSWFTSVTSPEAVPVWR